MLLTVCLNGEGYHPAAWRLSGQRPPLSARHYRDATALAESGGCAAALFGLSLFDASERASGRVPILLPDAMPLASSLIATTNAIGLGVTYALDRAEPHNIARSFATMDRLSLGRMAWIVELPRDQIHARNGYDREAECIDVVRKLWDSWEDGSFLADQASGRLADSDKVHRINHAGPHFTVRGPLNVPRSEQGQPVLVMTDPGNPAGRALAAGVADLLVVNGRDGDEVRGIRDDVRSLAASGARQPDELNVVMNVFIILGSTDAQAHQRASELEAAGQGLAGPICGWRFVGTPEALSEQLAQLHSSKVCEGFNIVPAVLPDDLRLFVERAIPAIRQKCPMPAQGAGRTLRERMGLRHPLSRYANERTGT